MDALVNIDFEKKSIKRKHTSLDIIRVGTCGALQNEIPVDTFILSTFGLGFDGLLSFYKPVYEPEEKALQKAFLQQTPWPNDGVRCVSAQGAVADSLPAQFLVRRPRENWVKTLHAMLALIRDLWK